MIIGNWKMNTLRADALALANALEMEYLIRHVLAFVRQRFGSILLLGL